VDHHLLELHNGSDSPLLLWIEPWGEELQIRAGATLKLIDTHDPPSSVSISFNVGSVSVYTMPSAKVRLMEGDIVVWSSFR
jgi:hypothetical protein